MAYEKKLVPSSGKGSSISVSGAICQGEDGAGHAEEPRSPGPSPGRIHNAGLYHATTKL